MKNTRNNIETEEVNGTTLVAPLWPGDGNFTLRLTEWDNGEGYDFHFPDGIISLTNCEFRAMVEIQLKRDREALIK